MKFVIIRLFIAVRESVIGAFLPPTSRHENLPLRPLFEA
jgi:hypothetical protein